MATSEVASPPQPDSVKTNDDHSNSGVQTTDSMDLVYAVRLTYMSLQGEANVSASNCLKVVNIISKYLYKKEIPLESLPSTQTALNMATEGQYLSKQHAVETILQCPHFMLGTDEVKEKSQGDAAEKMKENLSSFKREWAKYCPEIFVTHPMTDLCWVCQRKNTKISRSANLTLEVKAELIAEQNQHLMSVTRERSFYQSCVEDSKRTAEALGITMLEPSPSCSKPVIFHYSFDYAQQVHLPSNPLQPGPIYFLVPRKP
ncbi:hypothetical protein RRG08_041643 [Elysia crispata]|uniref:Uncharacterized protein n=1 Tax=Elysia crispata TaxID=231223 RepID=A0AAE0YAZ8_9GAST|nr:hypothetical protein RRG08_041643 [Elysia crispata]